MTDTTPEPVDLAQVLANLASYQTPTADTDDLDDGERVETLYRALDRPQLDALDALTDRHVPAMCAEIEQLRARVAELEESRDRAVRDLIDADVLTDHLCDANRELGRETRIAREEEARLDAENGRLLLAGADHTAYRVSEHAREQEIARLYGENAELSARVAEQAAEIDHHRKQWDQIVRTLDRITHERNEARARVAELETARRHLDHFDIHHNSGPRLPLPARGWAWWCHTCGDAALGLPDRATAEAHAIDHHEAMHAAAAAGAEEPQP